MSMPTITRHIQCAEKKAVVHLVKLVIKILSAVNRFVSNNPYFNHTTNGDFLQGI